MSPLRRIQLQYLFAADMINFNVIMYIDSSEADKNVNSGVKLLHTDFVKQNI